MMTIPTKLPTRYRIERRLGQGGLGEVFKVFDSHANRELALKILSQETSGARATLAREFKALSRLRHPSLIKVFDFGIIPPNAPYFTMEYVDGPILKEFLETSENLLLVQKTLWQILSALAYLHKNGILHGDIKPENIMISRDSGGAVRARLLDFGLASTFGRSKKTTSGTPRFLAPEILLHGTPQSPSTDLYALGITLIESITGIVSPLSSEIDTDFIKSVHNEMNSKLGASGVRNPSSLSSFILDLCRPDPSERMESAEAALRNLEILSPGVQSHRDQLTEGMFIGRGEEIQKIDSFLKPGYLEKKALIMKGPTGIGKKTLAERAVKIAELRRFVVIDLAASLPTYEAFRRLAETVISHVDEHAAKRFISKREELTEVESAGVPKAELSPDSGRALIFYDVLVQQLHDISQQRPILLLVSDMDRHSEDLLQFILYLTRQIDFLGSRIRLIATTNTDMAPAPKVRELQQKISSSSLSDALELGPFDEQEVRDLFTEIFGQPLLSERETQELIERTRGIPLIVMAFIRQLVSSGVIQLENDRWTLDRREYRESPIPENMDTAFGLALSDISEGEETVLQTLAIHGRAMGEKDLARLAPLKRGEPKKEIEHLVGRMILKREKDSTISFSHPLYMQFVLKQIEPTVRTGLHREVAEFMASHGSNDYNQIAQHYIQAGELGKAAQFGLRAADAFTASYMLYDASKLLLNLRDLANREKNRAILAAVLSRLGPVQYQTGLPSEALATYSDLCKSATEIGEKILYLRQMATICRASLRDVRRAKSILHKALSYATQVKDGHSMAEIHYQLGYCSARTDIAHFERAAELSARLDANLRIKSLAQLMYRYKISGDHSRVSRIQREIVRKVNALPADTMKDVLLHQSSVHFYNGDYRAARHCLEKKINVEREQDDILGMVYSLITLGGCCYTEGTYHSMISTLKEAYTLSRRYNILGSALTILANLSLAYRSLADYGLAMRMTEQAEALMKEEGIEQTSSYNYIKPAELFLLLGQATEKEFRAYAKKVRDTALKVTNNISLGHYNMSYSRYHLNTLRTTQALKYAREALELFTKARDRDDVALAHIQIAVIEVARSRTEEATLHINEAASIYEKIHCEYLKPFLMLGRGMLARCVASDDAKSILTEGLRTSKKMGTRETTWQIQRELALHHEGRGELNKALAFYRDAVETIRQITESIDDEKLKTSYLDVPFRKRVFAEIKELKKRVQSAQ